MSTLENPLPRNFKKITLLDHDCHNILRHIDIAKIHPGPEFILFR